MLRFVTVCDTVCHSRGKKGACHDKNSNRQAIPPAVVEVQTYAILVWNTWFFILLSV